MSGGRMRQSTRFMLAAVAMAGILPVSADAHFVLLEPASWLIENKLGDPQKMGPCGGTLADAGTPSNLMSEARGGQKLHIKVQESIFHPGHYRIALAVNSRAELPPDPEVATRETEKGPRSVSTVIQNPVRPPVLADGLWAHTTRPTEPWETDIELPNISCAKCTLQIVEFMAEHPGVREGGFSYHHCADLKITADPAKPIDTRWSTAR
jgi:hypothetical protein